MKFTDEDGKVWEWRGEYKLPQVGEHILSVHQSRGIVEVDPKDYFTTLRAVLHPVPTIHEFGGVKFEETGEMRLPKASEWCLVNGNSPFFVTSVTFMVNKYTILRPLQGE